MILKNRRTREILEMKYPEFRKKFAKEIQVAFDSFRKTELNKPFYNYKDDNSTWLELERGNNFLTYNADSNSEMLDVIITHNSIYAGV